MVAPVRGLVLGGGGITGIAWELGVIAGLAEMGVELARADIVVGTSAGSVVGAQLLSGVPVPELYGRQLEEPIGISGARLGLGFLVRWLVAMGWPGDEVAARRRLGRAAQRAATGPEAERLAVFRDALPSPEWPDRPLLVTAVDATTGQERVFDRDAGAGLVEAVAASCAVPLVWPAVTIEGRPYMDGGVRSATNTDLARGCDRVVVLAPIRAALRPRHRISAQLRSLGPGLRSVVISPDRAARRAIGRNVLDPARRVGAARAGHDQGRAVAEAVRVVWQS